MYFRLRLKAQFILSVCNEVSLCMFPKLSEDNVLIFIAGMLCGMMVFVVTFVASLLVL